VKIRLFPVSVSLIISVVCFFSCSPPVSEQSPTLYEIGDTGPSGVGIVFYISDGGLHGFEVSPADQATHEEYSNIQSTAIGTTSEAIGTGYANTQAIISQTGHTGSAAQVCTQYRAAIEGDWFLPSKNELEAIWNNLVDDGGGNNSGVGNFVSDGYACSTEWDSNNAWAFSFFDGTSIPLVKASQLRVRAVREF
jgi:hypothetical protein